MDLDIAKHVLDLFQRGPTAEEERAAKLWWEIQVRIVAPAVAHRALNHSEEEAARWNQRAGRLCALQGILAAARIAGKEAPRQAAAERHRILGEIELEAHAAADAN